MNRSFFQTSKYSGAQPDIFQGRGGFTNRGTSINFSSKTQEKNVPKGKILKLFLKDTLKTTF